MKLKKVLLGLVSVLAAASLLTGCGNDKTADKSAAPAEKKTITVGITPGDSEQIMEVVKKEAAKQP